MTSPFFEGFREGLLADPSGKQTPENLTPPQRQVNQAYLAAAYGIPRQGLAFHQQRLGLSPTDWLNPQIVFNALLEKSRSCKLRSRLANPSTRRAIAEKLSLISKIETP